MAARRSCTTAFHLESRLSGNQKEETITFAGELCLEGAWATRPLKGRTGLEMTLQKKQQLLQGLKGLDFGQMAEG